MQQALTRMTVALVEQKQWYIDRWRRLQRLPPPIRETMGAWSPSYPDGERSIARGGSMRVVLAMVMSADGKITRWGSPELHSWTSREDQRHFAGLVRAHSAIIMGRKTFDAARSMISVPNSKLRIVMTRTPQTYHVDAVKGTLEFTTDLPKGILGDLEARGHETVLLAGGGEINAIFFASSLVDELWLTVEPTLFGTGNPLIAPAKLDVALSLVSVEQMNGRGTLLLRYLVGNAERL